MKKIYSVFLFAFLVGGCSQNNDQTTVLKQQVTDLTSQVNQLQNQITQMQSVDREFAVSLYSLSNAEVWFTPSSTEFQVMHTNLGNLLVSLNSLTRYANGYKAVFEVGNPNLAILNGVTGVVRWGNAYSQNEDYGVWHDSLKTQDVEIESSLMPGVWNTVTVILSPATPSETSAISLALSVGQVELTVDRNQN